MYNIIMHSSGIDYYCAVQYRRRRAVYILVSYVRWRNPRKAFNKNLSLRLAVHRARGYIMLYTFETYKRNNTRQKHVCFFFQIVLSLYTCMYAVRNRFAVV